MDNNESSERYLNSIPVELRHELPDKLAAIWSRVQTPRLILRRLQPGDGPAMFKVHGDPETYRHSPAAPHPDLATSEEMLHQCMRHWQTYGFGYWAVTLVQEETILGFGGVEYRAWQGREILNLYYRFTPAAWGHGYATETARTSVSLAREHLPWWPVIARTRPYNLASQRVAQRAGLSLWPAQEGEHLIFTSERI